jgi:hypothetical protein
MKKIICKVQKINPFIFICWKILGQMHENLDGVCPEKKGVHLKWSLVDSSFRFASFGMTGVSQGKRVRQRRRSRR